MPEPLQEPCLAKCRSYFAPSVGMGGVCGVTPRQGQRALSPSPQKDRSCDEPESALPAWRMPRFPIMRRVSPSGVLPLCLDQAAIGRHNHEDRVWLICEQDDGSEQPAPLESAENGNAPEEPSDDGEARLHRWGRLARRLAPSWWWLGRRTCRWSRRRTWSTRGRDSHGSLLPRTGPWPRPGRCGRRLTRACRCL